MHLCGSFAPASLYKCYVLCCTKYVLSTVQQLADKYNRQEGVQWLEDHVRNGEHSSKWDTNTNSYCKCRMETFIGCTH